MRKYTLLRSSFSVPNFLHARCGIWFVFLAVVLVIAIVISSVATISRSIASVFAMRILWSRARAL